MISIKSFQFESILIGRKDALVRKRVRGTWGKDPPLMEQEHG